MFNISRIHKDINWYVHIRCDGNINKRKHSSLLTSMLVKRNNWKRNRIVLRCSAWILSEGFMQMATSCHANDRCSRLKFSTKVALSQSCYTNLSSPCSFCQKLLNSNLHKFNALCGLSVGSVNVLNLLPTRSPGSNLW